MKVMILCGGLGTRLGNLGYDVPKPMVPIGGKPMLWHIMSGFARWGFDDFILCLGYRSDVIKQYFLNLPLMLEDVTLDLSGKREPTYHKRPAEIDWRLTLVETGLESMTGHRVKRAGAYLDPGDECFALTYGDGVCDVDFREVVEFHRSHGKLATVTAVHPPGRFGELGIDGDDAVTEFNEKPQAEAGWISGGFFVFDRRFLDLLTDDPGLVLEREPLRRLAREGELVAYRHEGFWFCMDTPRDYHQLREMWAGGEAPWAVWERR